MTDDRILTVRVARIVPQTAEVLAFEFEHPWGGLLPTYEPGAHLNVHVPGGFARPYSLAAAPEPGARCRSWRIGVKRESASRGGSASLHERVRVGDLLAVSAPRNTFPLRAAARHHLLLAGGIGLTPLLAMAQLLQRKGASYTLAVFARSPQHLSFADDLALLGPRVQLHFDQPAEAAKLDLPRLVQKAPGDAHLYLCGPAGFMQAARDAAAGWPDERVHLEYFAPPDAAGGAGADEPFVLHLARSGIQVPVAADQTAVEALHEVGIDVPTSCQQGVCGTCVVPLAGGDADHRDYCLSAGERRTQVALCCSRARGGVLQVGM